MLSGDPLRKKISGQESKAMGNLVDNYTIIP